MTWLLLFPGNWLFGELLLHVGWIGTPQRGVLPKHLFV
jgi:hypothetical protein